MIAPAAMPDGWKFAYYLFPGHYPFSIVLYSQFNQHKATIVTDKPVPCGGDATLPCGAVCAAFAPPGGACPCGPAAVCEAFCEPEGACTAYAAMFGPNGTAEGLVERPYGNIFITVLYVAFFRLASTLALSYVNHQQR